MKKSIYFFTLLLFAFTSCEKSDMDSISSELSENSITGIALKGAVTVIGQNDPSIDLAAVQNAVDNHDRIILSGVFDFGFDEEIGGVDIIRPDVVIQGPATVRNGGKLEILQSGFWISYPLSIRAPGVEVHDLQFNGSLDTGIFVFVEEDGKPIVIDGNNINAPWASVFATATKGGLKVVNNTMEAIFGHYAFETMGTTEISHNEMMGSYVSVLSIATKGGLKVVNNTMEADYCYYALETMGTTEISHNEMQSSINAVSIESFNHRLDITNNTMSSIGYGGIYIGAWSVIDEIDPEWGNNPSVKIVGNTIDLEGPEVTGIMVGTSVHGINNVIVKDNTLTGEAGYGGLVKQPYGHNNKFINNDLTGLTTYSPQIWTMGGRDNHFQNNKLGIVAPFSVGESGPIFRDAATLVSTANWHLNDLTTPDPVNYNNHFSNNDYRLTGVTGWTDNPDESVGAVLLLDFIQKFTPSYPYGPYEEPFIMENFIAEKKFPFGTNVCMQVLDLSNLQGDDLVQGNNHIAGWTACEAHSNKATYQLVNNRYKNLGQRLNNRYKKREKVMFDRRN